MTQGPEQSESARVVLIDDDADIRELTRLALTRGGFDVVADVGDGGSGIWAVREHRPDVVLTDITMPVLGGLDALPTLRRLVPDAAIVFFSSHDVHSKLGSVASRQADGYLVKGTARPRDVVELVAQCRSQKLV